MSRVPHVKPRDPDRFTPFFGAEYVRQFSRFQEKGGRLNRALTHELGSTVVGPLVRHNASLESLTFLKLGFMAKRLPEAIHRVKAERFEKREWDRFKERMIKVAQDNPDFRVFQIGAFDGVSNDRLHPLLKKYKWQAILVEPLSASFAALQHTYRRQPNMQLVKAAITDVDGEAELIHINLTRGAALPKFTEMLATTHPEKVFATFPEYAHTATLSEWVPSRTLRSLHVELGEPTVDLLFVDAEGGDFEILNQLEAGAMPWPQFLVYEHDHMTEGEFVESHAILASHGYEAVTLKHDVIATRA